MKSGHAIPGSSSISESNRDGKGNVLVCNRVPERLRMAELRPTGKSVLGEAREMPRGVTVAALILCPTCLHASALPPFRRSRVGYNGWSIMKNRGRLSLGSLFFYWRTSSQNPLSLRNRYCIRRIRLITCWSLGWVLGASLPPINGDRARARRAWPDPIAVDVLGRGLRLAKDPQDWIAEKGSANGEVRRLRRPSHISRRSLQASTREGSRSFAGL